MTSHSTAAQHSLATLAADLRYADLPAAVVHQARRVLVDTLACALGGARSVPAEIVLRTATALGGTPECTVIGTLAKTSCAFATLVNGTMIRYLDMSDYYYGRDPSHPSGNVAPVIAMAERMHADGRALIEALVVAYEVQLRFTDCAGQPDIWTRGWHHATNMQFSAAAAAGRLLGLDAERIAHAIAIAGSHNNTLAQSQRGHIPLMKATAEATIAKGGVEAALLASHGLTGPDRLLEGELGYGKSVAGEIDYARLTAPCEGRYRISGIGMKPYAARAAIQAPVAAALDIRRQCGGRTEAITAIEAALPGQIMAMPSWDPQKYDPSNRETADHSFSYCMAVAMIDGDCGPAQFTDEKLHSAHVRALMNRITFVPDAELTRAWPGSGGCRVRATLRDGARIEALCRDAPGNASHPLTDEEVAGKLRRLATGVLSTPQIEQLLDRLWTIERCNDTAGLTSLLVPQ